MDKWHLAYRVPKTGAWKKEDKNVFFWSYHMFTKSSDLVVLENCAQM